MNTIIKRTFYVIRSITYNAFTKVGPTDGFRSDRGTPVNDATHFTTLDAVIDAFAKRPTEFDLRYEIVRVDRETTKGTTVPAKTERRVIKEGEEIPVDAKWIIVNGYTTRTLSDPQGLSCFDQNGTGGCRFGANNFSTTPLFDTVEDMLNAAFSFQGFAGQQPPQTRRVIVTETPAASSPDKVNDTLTVVR